jgi:hypothetical protein
MNTRERLPLLVIVLCVLLVALYTSRTTTAALGLLVALTGLVVSYLRPVLGIPVGVAMAVVAATVPWAVVLVLVVAGLLTLATKAPGVASTKVNPAFAMIAANGVSPTIAELGDVGGDITGSG